MSTMYEPHGNSVHTTPAQALFGPDTPTTEEPPLQPTILDRVAGFVERFVFLQKKSLYRLIATWVLATYLAQRFEYIGYLFAHSPEPQSGKSRLLEVLELLVCEPALFVRPTEAVLFRTAGRTQLLDEVDGWTNRDELRSVLNAGFRNGGTVPRMEKDANGNFRVNNFPVYGPRALAGIGTGILDETTRDRTFMIQMVRQTKAERRERFTRKVRHEAQGLKAEIEQWAKDHADEVATLYEETEFSWLEDFRDRTVDVGQPLAAVLEVVYKDHPLLDDARSCLIEAVAITRKDQETLTDNFRVLRELARLAETEDPLIGTASELAEMCSGVPEQPGLYDVSATLQKYGFQTKSVRKDGKPAYRYVLPRKELADLLSRYGGSGRKDHVDAETAPATTPEPAEIPVS